MSAGVRCPHCNFMHSVRTDGRCPRCRKDVRAAAPSAPAPAGSARAPKSRGPLFAVVAVVLVAAAVIGYRYSRFQGKIDYSTQNGLLAPIYAGEWINSVDESARIQVATDGWFRHTDPESDRVLLSSPESDTHVVLRVETTGKGRRAPHSGDIANRAIGRLEQNVAKLDVTRNEKIDAEDGNAYRVDAEVVVEQTRLAYRYHLASRGGRVATLVCFGPPEVVGQRCPTVLESFSWSS